MNPLTRPGYSWTSALVLFCVAFGAELLPIVGGTGERMRFDWSFTYVTLHFIILPLGAIVHIAWNAVALVLRRSRPLRDRWIDAASVAVSVAYLVLLQLRPVFPLWADVLWKQIQSGR